MLSNISGNVKMHTLLLQADAHIKAVPVSSCRYKALKAADICPARALPESNVFYGYGEKSGGLKGYKLRSHMSRKEAGIGVVEVILILLVLVGLVLIFKEEIVSLANSIFTNINSQVDEV